MTWRVVLTGPECSGKTTLARLIAARFRAPWVPEASRAYAEARGGVLTAADVEPIARATVDALRRGEADAPPVLVADTDLVSTMVYARHYYGACPDWIEKECRERKGDVYLLCAPDLPWEPDGVRDRPDERDRIAIFYAFDNVLHGLGAQVVHVSGTGEARATLAVNAVLDAAPAGTVAT